MKNKLKSRKQLLEILAFKDKYSTRILTKKSIFGYESRGLWLNYNQLVHNPYWEVYSAKDKKEIYTVGTFREGFIITSLKVKDEGGDPSIIIEKKECKVPICSKFLIRTFVDAEEKISYIYKPLLEKYIRSGYPENTYTYEEIMSIPGMQIWEVVNRHNNFRFAIGNVTYYRLNNEVPEKMFTLRKMVIDTEKDDIAAYNSKAEGTPVKCYLSSKLVH